MFAVIVNIPSWGGLKKSPMAENPKQQLLYCTEGFLNMLNMHMGFGIEKKLASLSNTSTTVS